MRALVLTIALTLIQLSSALGQQSLSPAKSLAFQKRLASHWDIRGIRDRPEELIVDVRVRLTQQGALAAPPTVVSSGTSPYYQEAADAAVQALKKGQPYDMLRAEDCGVWKDMIVTFDPRLMSTSH